MLKINETFEQYGAETSEFPHGHYIDSSSNTSNDGTLVSSTTPNDVLGGDEALLSKAGMEPSGLVDTALSSDRLTAHRIVSVMTQAVSDYAAGDDDAVGLIADGVNVGNYSYVIHPDSLTKWYTNGATGTLDGVFDTVAGQAGGASVAFTRVDVPALTDRLDAIESALSGPAYSILTDGGEYAQASTGTLPGTPISSCRVGGPHRVAIACDTTNQLQLWQVVGGDLARVGSPYTSNVGRYPKVCHTSDPDTVFLMDDSGDDSAQAGSRYGRYLVWGGSSWSQVGPTLTAYGTSGSRGKFSVTPLGDNTVAICDSRDGTLKVWRSNGVAWLRVGPIYTFGAASTNGPRQAICALSGDRIAFVDGVAGTIRALSWSGSGFSADGGALALYSSTGSGDPGPWACALSTTDVAVLLRGAGQIDVYRLLEGGDPTLVSCLPFPDVSQNSTEFDAISALAPNLISVVGNAGAYRWAAGTVSSITGVPSP